MHNSSLEPFSLFQLRPFVIVSSTLVSTMAELFSFLRFFLIRVRLWRAVAGSR